MSADMEVQQVCTICWNGRKVIQPDFMIDKNGIKICKKSSPMNRHEYKPLIIKKAANGQWEEDSNPEQYHISNFKTEMCKHLVQLGKCTYGPKCRFAHNQKELELNRARFAEAQKLLKCGKLPNSTQAPAAVCVVNSTPLAPQLTLAPTVSAQIARPQPAQEKLAVPSKTPSLPPKSELKDSPHPMQSRLADYMSNIPLNSTLSEKSKTPESNFHSSSSVSPVLSSASSLHSFGPISAPSSKGMARSSSASSQSSLLSQSEDTTSALLMNILKESGSVTAAEHTLCICQWCDRYLAMVRCDKCELSFCDPCSARRHSRGTGTSHGVLSLFNGSNTHICAACEGKASACYCGDCLMFYCDLCAAHWHARGAYARHKLLPVSPIEAASETKYLSAEFHVPVVQDPVQCIPIDFVCPITHELMKDPVMTEDGHSYERSAIEAWLRQHQTSPKTNLPLGSKRLLENQSLRAAICTWIQCNGLTIC